MPPDSRDDLRDPAPGDDDGRWAPGRRGVRNVSAILPNGRIVWLRVAPNLAPAASLRAAASAANRAAQWRRAEAAANQYGIHRLARSLAGEAEKISDAHVERRAWLRREAVAGDDRIARRLTKAGAAFRSRLARQIEIERTAVERLAERDLWDKILIATSLPLFAAYGQAGNPFGANNLALVLSLAIWLVGDEIRDALFGSDERSPYPVRQMDAWSYLAPLGNLLTGWWLMSELQHERFITGVTKSFVPRAPVDLGGGKERHEYVSTVNLARYMPPGYFAEFATFDEVRAVVTPAVLTVSAAGAAKNTTVEVVSAAVRNGFLEIHLRALSDIVPPGEPVFDAIEIAWLVDTHKPESASQ